ncbi:MAG: DUF3841 domain-containing protein [Clostridia bacterium]|nr:DUF3841 domain-containing protein [Clostridia bacterium]
MNSDMKFYTAQNQIVLDTISEQGYSVVKKSYIEEKYGHQAKLFLRAYDWFVRHSQQRVIKPSYAEYPIWLFLNPNYVTVHPDQQLLALNIPTGFYTLFDNAGWERILSMDYVGSDTSDQLAFSEKLHRMGLDCGYRAFESPFYPHIQREILQSWSRIFNLTEQSVVRAAVWEIKKEWLCN